MDPLLSPSLPQRSRTSGRARLLPAALSAALLLGAGAGPDGDPTRGRGQIRGQISGPSNRPLVGISIVLAPQGHPHVVYATSTDEDGRYRFDHLVTDTYQVRADGQGFETMVKNGIAVKPPFRSIIDLAMKAGGIDDRAPASAGDTAAPTGRIGTLHGWFLNNEAEPVLEGTVIFRRVGHPEDLFHGRTDSDGRFQLQDLPSGLYDITARSPGLIPLHLVRRPLAPAQELHMKLAAPPYPLTYRGWIDDLLPREIPLPPALPRQVELDQEARTPAPDEAALPPEEAPESEPR